MRKAIVFDLDDTLYPEWQYNLSGFQAVSAWLLETHSITVFFEVACHFFSTGNRGNIFDLTLNKLGITYTKDLITEMVRVYRDHTPCLSLYEDAQWALSYFQGKVLIGLITDGYLLTQKRKVSALQIENYFDAIIYSDQYGKEHWKPSQTPYIKIMEEIGCAGTECVYIGDNPTKDFITAKKLGWLTMQIYRACAEYKQSEVNKEYAAHIKIKSLREIPAIIGENQSTTTG